MPRRKDRPRYVAQGRRPCIYRVVLVKNKKAVKILFRNAHQERAYDRYNKLISDNVVYFPKRFNNAKTIATPVVYELLLIKKRTEADKDRMVRNDIGQMVEEKSTSKNWVILERKPYNIEETLYVFGHDPIHDRFDFKRILKEILMKNIRLKGMVKEVVIVNNKIIIQSDWDDFNLILCKCTSDAIRLHDTLKKAVSKSAMKNILFLGRVWEHRIGDMYQLIMEHTGWSRVKVGRVTTKH